MSASSRAAPRASADRPPGPVIAAVTRSATRVMSAGPARYARPLWATSRGEPSGTRLRAASSTWAAGLSAGSRYLTALASTAVVPVSRASSASRTALTVDLCSR